MNDIELKDYIDKRLSDFDRRFSDRFILSDQAVNKAEHTMNQRLNSMNEFRDALKDQTARMATRLEVEKIDQDVRELQKAKSNFEGKIFVISGVISSVISIILYFVTKN